MTFFGMTSGTIFFEHEFDISEEPDRLCYSLTSFFSDSWTNMRFKFRHNLINGFENVVSDLKEKPEKVFNL